MKTKKEIVEIIKDAKEDGGCDFMNNSFLVGKKVKLSQRGQELFSITKDNVKDEEVRNELDYKQAIYFVPILEIVGTHNDKLMVKLIDDYDFYVDNDAIYKWHSGYKEIITKERKPNLCEYIRDVFENIFVKNRMVEIAYNFKYPSKDLTQNVVFVSETRLDGMVILS